MVKAGKSQCHPMMKTRMKIFLKILLEEVWDGVTAEAEGAVVRGDRIVSGEEINTLPDLKI
jgi:hypothetical protein